ncbi:hypothetical protein L861_12805 [Litchfieldella anticariensis FP35 = DSM 16096]|uniref:TonB C-terminal domain-containing protein n=1 Tax=Litchfieldella anticariensis (strain DSM 16096 / CECT 5854 / CIP 108499 / LMG 22089 / FP35) TaxID=1121939 RepID=S2KER3_LITA3|nr:TonB family protein [Halomonas anticariensis]EPC00667.1 hypothetical protein L861_12805 [Halomonas anticariensis FP35 = DSM 16096]
MALTATDPVYHSAVTRPYRHWLAWVASLLLHVAVLGAVASWTLAPETPPVRYSSIDVTLVTQPSVAAEAVEASAEANQQASDDEVGKPSEREMTPETPDVTVPDEAIEQAAKPEPAESTSPSPAASVPKPANSSSSPPSEPISRTNESSSSPSTTSPPANGRDLLAQATASVRQQGFDASHMGAGNESPEQQAAKARYIDAWTRRVEEYGNRFHPAPAHIAGQLRIRVVIDHEGQLLQVEVVQSSGHSELDQAALDTVQGAAPYRPFDRGMAGLERLTITRVWRFGNGNNFGVR